MFGPGGPTLIELAVQGLSATDRGYDLLAPKFHATPFRTPNEVLDLAAKQLATGPRIGRLLDLCCGTGAVFERWAHLFDEGVGVDFSEGMLEVARRFQPPSGTTCRYVHADVLQWPPDGAFDVVTSFGAFGHFDKADQPAFMAAVHRALKPGGRFVFVTGPRQTPRELWWWLLKGFNATMRVRNALLSPPFVMYYFLFDLDESLALCRSVGLEPKVTPLGWQTSSDLVLVEAVRA